MRYLTTAENYLPDNFNIPDKKLKIGFWGNTNNNPFMVARALRKKGHEVLFIIDEEQRLSRPEFRYEDISTPYPEWIRDFSPLPLFLVGNLIDEEKKNWIIEALRDCDLVVLNGYAVRFADEIKKPCFIHLTGADLIPLADPKYIEVLTAAFLDNMDKQGFLKKNSKGSIYLGNKLFLRVGEILMRSKYRHIDFNNNYMVKLSPWENLLYVAGYRLWMKEQIRRQGEGIKRSVGYIYSVPGIVPTGDRLIKKLGIPERTKITYLTVDTDYALYTPMPSNAIPRVFNIARFNWVPETSKSRGFHELDFKGNDIMIKGIGLYYRKTGKAIDLRFVKKGKDMEETYRLCKNEGIDTLITWLDELTQKQVMEEYRKADILFDQLATSVVTMGGLEGMAVGRPLIANSRPEIYEKFLGERTAICQAKTPVEVCHWLEKLTEDAAFREKKGKESRDFVLRHFSADKMADRYLNAYYTFGVN